MPEAGRGGAGADGAPASARAETAAAGDWRVPLEQWCRDAGARVLVHDQPVDLPEGAADAPVGLPGTLETVADPAALLADLAARGAPLAAAVTWTSASPTAAARSLHPASLVGLLGAHYAVTQLTLADGVLGAQAQVEGDAEARRRANETAVIEVQGELEAALQDVLRAAAASAAHRAAAAELQTALIGSDEDHFAARKVRNDTRARLRAEREAAQAQREQSERRIADLEVQLEAATRRANRLDARLTRIIEGRWWQIGEVVADVRRDPRQAGSAPARFWRAVRKDT